MRLSTRDKDIVCDCILDNIQNKNNTIKSVEDLNIECEKNILKDFQALITSITSKKLVINKLQKEFEDVCETIKEMIKTRENTLSIYFQSYNPAREEILKHLTKCKEKEYDKLYKKYNMISVPTKHNIEMMLMKSETKDIPTLIKEITNLIEKKNEYIEIQK